MADVLDLNAEEFVEEDDGNRNAFTTFLYFCVFHIYDFISLDYMIHITEI